MAIIERIKGICLKPKSEWEAIATETPSPSALYLGYAAPLAAIPVIAGFIGGSLIGRTLPIIGTYRVPLVTGVVAAIFSFVMALVGIFILSLIINALAPSFGGEKNNTQALKLAVYSYTPAWIAGVLQILPLLGLLALLAGLYGLYILYLGLPRLMKCPQEKAIGYTAVVVICAIVLSVIVGMIARGTPPRRSDVVFGEVRQGQPLGQAAGPR
jgi:MFS family permease